MISLAVYFCFCMFMDMLNFSFLKSYIYNIFLLEEFYFDIMHIMYNPLYTVNSYVSHYDNILMFIDMGFIFKALLLHL